MSCPLPMEAFKRCSQAVVKVDMFDLDKTVVETMTVVAGMNVSKPRRHQVSADVNGNHLQCDFVRSDMVADQLGHVKRVTLKLPDGNVLLLVANAAGRLIPLQAVWMSDSTRLARVG